MHSVGLGHFQTQGGRVYTRMCEMIAGRDIQPGEVVSIRGLASELGVSVTPVRDAVNLLRQQGLLEKVPGTGYRVVGVTRERIAGVFAVRRALLVESARLAAQRITDGEIAELELIASRVDALIESSHYEESSRVDQEFHTRIAQIAGLAFLQREIARLEVFKLVFPPVGPVPPEWHSHTEVVDAIAARDPERADEEMRAHVNRPLEPVLASFGDEESEDGIANA